MLARDGKSRMDALGTKVVRASSRPAIVLIFVASLGFLAQSDDRHHRQRGRFSLAWL